jgi:hypothetical protein
MTPITETYRSKSAPNKPPYECIAHADGKLMCNCRGWATWKNKELPASQRPARTCTHCDDLVRKHALTAEDRGEFRYVVLMGDDLRGVRAAAHKPEPVAKPKALKPVEAAPVRKSLFKVIPELDEPDLDAYVNPMLASPMPDLPNQKVATVLAAISRYKPTEWVMEEKYDGHRVVVAIKDGQVSAWSRPNKGNDALVRTLPEHLVKAFSVFPNVTVDGELYVPGGISTDVTTGGNESKLQFVVFDIMRVSGLDATHKTLDERRALLTAIFDKVSVHGVTLAPQFAPSAERVQAIFDRQGEGAILKRRAARYQPGARSADFIKVKGLETCVMEVVGYKKGKNGPHSTVLLKNPVDGSTLPIKTLDMNALRAFDADPDAFIGRRLLMEYQFRTRDGGYRHPRWDRWENE